MSHVRRDPQNISPHSNTRASMHAHSLAFKTHGITQSATSYTHNTQALTIIHAHTHMSKYIYAFTHTYTHAIKFYLPYTYLF